MTSRITASKLKAQLLGVLDDVAQSGSSVTVTKFGKPVARIVPIEDQSALSGSVRFLVDDDELTEPIPEVWDASSR